MKIYNLPLTIKPTQTMKFYHVILILVISLFICCRHGNTISDKSDTTKHPIRAQQENKVAIAEIPSVDTPQILDLSHGFKIKASHGENFGKFKTYSYLETWHNNLKIFADTTAEYEFDEKPYPIFNMLKPEVFELLIQINDRPNKDKLLFLRIENDRVVKHEKLPTFDGNPEKINGLLYYSGRWDDSEVWEKNGKEYGPYNPTIYYKFTPDGIKLDSALTILRNKEKYGKFHGFHYDEKIGYPTTHGNKIDTSEKNIIKNN